VTKKVIKQALTRTITIRHKWPIRVIKQALKRTITIRHK
jgi:hypothetical protein